MSRANRTEIDWPVVPLGHLLNRVQRREAVKPDNDYDILGAHWYAKGLYIKHTNSSQIYLSR